MASTTSDFIVTSGPAALAALSDVVASGRVVDVQPGRSWRVLDGVDPSMNRNFAVLKLDADQHVGHADKGSVYFEVPVDPGTDYDALRRDLPSEQLVFFGYRVDFSAPLGAESVDNDAGRPADTALYAPMSLEGLLIDRDGTIFTMIGEEGSPWPHRADDDFWMLVKVPEGPPITANTPDPDEGGG